MCNTRLDNRSVFPDGMEEYLETYGWHISKGLCMWAVKRMKGKSSNVIPSTKEEVEGVLARHGVNYSKYKACDHVYVYNMGKFDYLGSSIPDESRLALFVKDYLDDPDGYDEVAMTRLYADCIGKGCMPPWDEVI